MKSLLTLGYIAVGIGNLDPVLLTQTNYTQRLVQTTPASKPQTSPLVQAAGNLLRLERYQLESAMEITGDIPGTFFRSQANINTTVEAPHKINSQITFVSPNGLEGKTYQIISDGSQVWIYNLMTNQYSVSNTEQFLQTRESFLIGTLSHFYVTTRSNIGNSAIAANFLAKLPEARLIGYFQRFANINLQNTVIRDETIDGKAYKVYDLDISNRGFKTSAYINPDSTTIERVHLSGTKDGLQLAATEQILNQNLPESISAKTFSFSPPEGAEQVPEQITIEPF